MYKSTSKWNFLVVLPLVLLILLFATEIIRLLYGNDYAPGSTALIILSFGIAMNDFSGTAGNILVGSGHTKLNLVCEAIAAVMNILLNILLIPRYGITGAAVATSISYTARNISAVSFVYFKFGIHPFKASYLRLSLAGLITTGTIYGLKMILPFSWLISMILLGFTFILIYTSLAVLFRSLDRNDGVIIEAIESKTNIDLSLIKRFI